MIVPIARIVAATSMRTVIFKFTSVLRRKVEKHIELRRVTVPGVVAVASCRRRQILKAETPDAATRFSRVGMR